MRPGAVEENLHGEDMIIASKKSGLTLKELREVLGKSIKPSQIFSNDLLYNSAKVKVKEFLVKVKFSWTVVRKIIPHLQKKIRIHYLFKK